MQAKLRNGKTELNTYRIDRQADYGTLSGYRNLVFLFPRVRDWATEERDPGL